MSLIDPTVALWAVAIATLAGLVHGYSGFGGALLMVPMLSLLLPPVDAVVVTTVAAVIGQLPVARQAKRQACWTEVRFSRASFWACRWAYCCWWRVKLGCCAASSA